MDEFFFLYSQANRDQGYKKFSESWTFFILPSQRSHSFFSKIPLTKSKTFLYLVSQIAPIV